MNIQNCVRCGGKLNVENGEYRCAECGSAWTAESARLAYEAFKATVESGTKTAIDEAFVRDREKRVASLRRQLWQEVHTEEPYIDCGKVAELAGKILELDPKAVDAGFYVLAGRDQWKKVNKYLSSLDAQKHKRYVEDFIDFLTRPYVGKCLLQMNDLLDRSFAETSKEYLRCHDKIAKSASDDFNPSLSRAAFVAYSSEDKEKAYELVEALEDRGLKCFISMRNSKKGRNANLYYEKDLQTAMDHCLVFVFVSTKNSRTEGCKARDEIEYIRSGDVFALPSRELQNYYMNRYGLLPVKDKKPRVEWLVNEYPKPIKDAYEKDVNEFFDGFSRYGDMKTVVDRVEELARIRPSAGDKPEGGKSSSKYCALCGSENPTKAKLCMECGHREFVSTYAEYENILLRKRIEELEAGAKKPVAEEKASTGTEKPEGKTEKKPTAKPEAKPEIKPTAKPEAKPEKKTESKPAETPKKGGEADLYATALEQAKKSLTQEEKPAETEIGTSYADAIARAQKSLTQEPKTVVETTDGTSYADAIARAQKSLTQKETTPDSTTEQAYADAILRAKKSLEQPAVSEPSQTETGSGLSDEIHRVERLLREKPTATAITPPKTTATAITPPKTTATAITPPKSTATAITPPKTTAKAITPPKPTAVTSASASKPKKLKDAQELYREGKNFEYGLGGKKDYAKALECYKQAAEQGHSRATYEVGMMYFMEKGIDRSYREAVKWFEKALQLGEGDAAYWLACCYHIGGNGITQDFEKAVYWYERAAKESVLRREAKQGLRRAKKGKPYA